MRKRLIRPTPKDISPPDQEWLNLEQLANVEITSEDASHPIESALLPERESSQGSGWVAAEPGEQTIRLIFDQPVRLVRIWLLFIESEVERTQEFVLRWSPDNGQNFREVVRQQWNFSPPATIRELEDYRVDLSGVTVFELTIVPNKDGGTARASIAQLRLG
ncbi:MAG TPA: hypothetical protein VI756_30000 [Blastocatellia bacterium]